ncbi:MAG: lipoyl synthase [bacterium]|nr:lipoyl synthase [bacterium]
MKQTKDQLRLPEYLRNRIKNKQTEVVVDLQNKLKKINLNTVCQSARCPNLGECFVKGTATFMILGTVCSRNCRFCNVDSGTTEKVNPDEPGNISIMVRDLGLKHVVITSVTRDDLEDQGAGQFIKTVNEIKRLNTEVTIEILTPDFGGDIELLESVLEIPVAVFNHNIETIERLYPVARPQAVYKRSLNVLKLASQFKGRIFFIKSGFMTGLGESEEEIHELMQDLFNAGVEILTIGQYLRPSLKHLEVKKYYLDDEFEKLQRIGEKIGFKKVFSGPFVRSSFNSGNILNELKGI